MHGADDVGRFESLADGLPLGGAIVVATAGTHDSDGALRVAVELSAHHAVDVQLISVIEESDFVEYPGSTPADIARASRDAIASREGELAAQRNRTRIAAHNVQVSIRIGCRVDEIVRCAREHDAALIVMGTGSNGVLARLLHRQTVMRVAAATAVPILAVPADGHALGDPRVWLVALKGVGIIPAESERWCGL